MAVTAEVRPLCAAGSLLGEGIVWDTGRQCAWFVDIKKKLLWQYDPVTGASRNWEAPEQIGWALPAEDGRLLCGLKDGLHIFEPADVTFAFHAVVPGEPASNRLNDACTDPWGRVWFGSMDDAEADASGRFYCYDRGKVRAAGPSGIAITNGPAVNASGTRIYFTDTLAKRVFVAQLDAKGVGESSLFVDTARDFPAAFPDGPVVDADDYVWTGLYLGGKVARFSPEGVLVTTVDIPARDVTKVQFGGADLSIAFVTTATKNMEPSDMEVYPDAGSLFAFPAPGKGVATTPVKLP